MAGFAEVDDVFDGELLHGFAAVGSTAAATEGLIEVGGVFAGGDPDGGAVVFRFESRGAGDLADVADGVLVGGGVPVESSPFFRRDVCRMNEDRDVLGIERMAVGAAVLLPEVVVVEFDFVRVIFCG